MNEYNHLINKLKKYEIEATGKLDPITFIENFVTIQHPVRGSILFKVYDYQKEMINTFEKSNTITMSARQMGTTITGASYLLYKALEKPNQQIVILADKYYQAREILERIKYSFDNIPEGTNHANIKYTKKYKQKVSFSNGSYIRVSAVTRDALRGCSPDILYVDNLGYVNNSLQEEFNSICCAPLAATGTRVILNNTGSGYGLYREIFENAFKGKNSFTPIRIKWDQFPTRSECFKQDMINMLGEDGWEREYECGLKIKQKWWERNT